MMARSTLPQINRRDKKAVWYSRIRMTSKASSAENQGCFGLAMNKIDRLLCFALDRDVAFVVFTKVPQTVEISFRHFNTL